VSNREQEKEEKRSMEVHNHGEKLSNRSKIVDKRQNGGPTLGYGS
jgi:hypothetical protein